MPDLSLPSAFCTASSMHGGRAFLCDLHIARRESEPERCSTLKSTKTLETFDFAFNPCVNCQLTEDLVTSMSSVLCVPPGSGDVFGVDAKFWQIFSVLTHSLSCYRIMEMLPEMLPEMIP
jgi:hypothetical protein